MAPNFPEFNVPVAKLRKSRRATITDAARIKNA